jgi:hypothetical protein
MSIAHSSRRTVLAVALSLGIAAAGTPIADALACAQHHHVIRCAAGKHPVKRHGKRFCVKRRHQARPVVLPDLPPVPTDAQLPQVSADQPYDDAQLDTQADPALPEDVIPDAQDQADEQPAPAPGDAQAGGALPFDLAALDFPHP